MAKRLYLSRTNYRIGGVCGGLAEYLEADPTIIRLAWVLFALASFGTGALFYVLAWVIIPEAPKKKAKKKGKRGKKK